MAHFAQLDSSNTVIQVIVVSNDEIIDAATGLESEARGVEMCQLIFGAETRWVQTSYSGTIRGRFAGIGFFYDGEQDVFRVPKPYSNWVFNPQVNEWQAPIARPDDELPYRWDEPLGAWVLVEPPATVYSS
jgi:hypothetical protein